MNIFSAFFGPGVGAQAQDVAVNAGLSVLGAPMEGVGSSALSFGERLAEAVEQRLSGSNPLAESKVEAVSRQDIMKLRDALEKNGLPREVASELNKLAEGVDKISINKVLNKLRQKVSGGEGAPLEGPEFLAAKQMLQKIGFLPEEADTLIEAMGEGKATGVWKEIMKRLSKAEPDQFFDLSSDEVSALAKGLGLSESVTATLQQLLAGGELSANNDAVKHLLSSITQEMAGREQALKQLNVALGESLGDVMAKLREQNTRSAQADNRGSKTADNSEALILETVIGKREDSPALGLHDGRKEHGEHGREGRDGSGRKTASGRGSAWDTLLSRVGVSADFVPDAAGQGQSEQAQAAMRSGRAGQTAYLSEQAAQQVEKAILSNMHDGAKQLALKLNPPELGALTVTLVVRGNEVTAVLKTDQPETAQLLQEQMNHLRASLEEQGLKVAKLDVQAEVADSGADQNAWQGAEQHNMEQEQQARAEERERFQRLRRMREADAAGLAQEMLIPGMPANIASGLNLIA